MLLYILNMVAFRNMFESINVLNQWVWILFKSFGKIGHVIFVNKAWTRKNL